MFTWGNRKVSIKCVGCDATYVYIDNVTAPSARAFLAHQCAMPICRSRHPHRCALEFTIPIYAKLRVAGRGVHITYTHLTSTSARSQCVSWIRPLCILLYTQNMCDVQFVLFVLPRARLRCKQVNLPATRNSLGVVCLCGVFCVVF